MDKLFTAIQTAVLAITDDDDNAVVKRFDWDNGELDGNSPAVPITPMVLMDIDNIPFEEAGRGLDIGEMTVKIKCGFRIKGRSDSNAPESQQQTALEFLSSLKQIGAAIRGLRSENTGPMVREDLQRLQVDGLKVYEYTFTCEYYESSNLVTYTEVEKPDLEITEQ